VFIGGREAPMSPAPAQWLSAATARARSNLSYRAMALKSWSIVSAAVENFIENNDLLRAAALTYTVALSIVPILALAFSALHGLGVEQQLRPLVERYLALGSSSTADQLMSYVSNVNAAALGTVGAAFLIVTVISTLGTIEQAFNTIFRVPRSRGYLRKFSDYLSVLFTVPLMVAAALAVTTMISVRMTALPFLTGLAPYLMIWAGFFFLFVFFPYTAVRWGPAAAGSLVTAILFQIALWGYVRFQVGVASYRAIYGALATVPIFLVWIYVGWCIVLIGAEITAAAQRGTDPVLLRPESPDFPCAAALYALVRLAERQMGRGGPVTATDIAHELGVSAAALEPVIDGLKDAEIIVEAEPKADQPHSGLFLVKHPAAIPLADAIGALLERTSGAEPDSRVAAVMRAITDAQTSVLKQMTLADLLEKPPGHTSAGADAPDLSRIRA
jgi:membrane protein